MMTADLIPPTDAVDAAIARVLDAEHGAREAVTQAAEAAATMLEETRAAVRLLEERTERRIRGVRAAFEASAAAEVAALDATTAQTTGPHALTADETARVESAVAALAALLTGSGI